MTDHIDPRDRELIELFNETLDEAANPSEGFVDLVMAGYDLTSADEIIAELVQDSDLDREPALVRGPDLGARVLAFAVPELRIELEIGFEAPEIVGRVAPAQEGTVTLEQAERSEVRAIDPSGHFEFSLASSRPFRIKYTDGRVTVTTEWIIP